MTFMPKVENIETLTPLVIILPWNHNCPFPLYFWNFFSLVEAFNNVTLFPTSRKTPAQRMFYVLFKNNGFICYFPHILNFPH